MLPKFECRVSKLSLEIYGLFESDSSKGFARGHSEVSFRAAARQDFIAVNIIIVFISWYGTDDHDVKISPDKVARQTIHSKHVTLHAIVPELLMWSWWKVHQNVWTLWVSWPARDRLTAHSATKSRSGRVHKKNLEKYWLTCRSEQSSLTVMSRIVWRCRSFFASLCLFNDNVK